MEKMLMKLNSLMKIIDDKQSDGNMETIENTKN